MISVEGINISFLERGASVDPTILLLHGLGDCARSWDNFSQSMSDKFRIISLDSRGHGDSGKSPSGRYLLDDYVVDLKAVEKKLGLGSFVLVGHGNGGRIALHYTHKNPNKVRGLVIADSNLSPKNDSQIHSLLDIKGNLDDDSSEPFVDILKTRQPLSSNEMLLHQADALTMISKEGIRTWKHDVAVMKGEDPSDLWEQWRNLKCPTLLLRGRQSNVVSHEEAVRMKENLVSCSLVELEGGGHWLYQESPGSFESATRWFIEKYKLI